MLFVLIYSSAFLREDVKYKKTWLMISPKICMDMLFCLFYGLNYAGIIERWVMTDFELLQSTEKQPGRYITTTCLD